MNVVYIVIYSNHFEEEWYVKSVWEDGVAAARAADRLTEKHGSRDRSYTVEKWSIQ